MHYEQIVNRFGIQLRPSVLHSATCKRKHALRRRFGGRDRMNCASNNRKFWPDCSLLPPEGKDVFRCFVAGQIGLKFIIDGFGLGRCKEVPEEIFSAWLLGGWRKDFVFNF